MKTQRNYKNMANQSYISSLPKMFYQKMAPLILATCLDCLLSKKKKKKEFEGKSDSKRCLHASQSYNCQVSENDYVL